jgi:hypothetical protein
MIFRWLKRRRELAARVAAEADTMIALFGDGAYHEARKRVEAARRTQRDESFWTKVRTEIAHRTRRDWVDTATRYLEPDGHIKVWPRREAEEFGMKAKRSQGLDIGKMEAAFKRAAHTAVHGTREERSGRFLLTTLIWTKYDANANNLEVRLVNGRTYLYSNVPSSVYEALVGAESQRAFFDAFIRNQYSCREL